MVNSKFDADSFYFSGQGVVMIGKRDPITGQPQGFRPVGNVSELKITVATTVVDHKGSQDGQRAIDKRLQTETKATASITIDNWIAANLANALRGNYLSVPAGAVVDEVVAGGPGLVSGLAFINVTNVVAEIIEAELVAYVDDLTPWDYKVNADAGSIMLNDGTGVGPTASLGVVPTAVLVGATTSVTVVSTALPGERVFLKGFAGADAALLNGQIGHVLTNAAGVITVDINTLGKVITIGVPIAVFLDEIVELSVSYGYSAQWKVDTLTQPLTDQWLRFEGLNTVAENSPVIVDLFKFETDPLKELALLSDTFGSFVMEGALLSDSLRPTGTSKYFSVKMLTTPG